MEGILVATLPFLVLLHHVVCDVRLGHFQFDIKQHHKQDSRNHRELNEAIKKQLDAYFSTVRPIDEDFHIPVEKVKELKTLYHVADKDHDGKLSLEEMRELVDARHILTEEDLKNLIAEADTNHDGQLSIQELAQHLAKKGLPAEKQNVNFDQDLPRLLDLNQDNEIDMEELHRMYKFCNQNFQQQLIERIIQIGDVNNDHQLNYKELSSVLKAKSDVLTGGGVEEPTDDVFNRIKYCMATFIEKCRHGWCSPGHGHGHGHLHSHAHISILDIIKLPFMIGFSFLRPFI